GAASLVLIALALGCGSQHEAGPCARGGAARGRGRARRAPPQPREALSRPRASRSAARRRRDLRVGVEVRGEAIADLAGRKAVVLGAVGVLPVAPARIRVAEAAHRGQSLFGELEAEVGGEAARDAERVRGDLALLDVEEAPRAEAAAHRERAVDAAAPELELAAAVQLRVGHPLGQAEGEVEA